MLKRVADWMEKVSVAAFAVGIFQRQAFLGLTMAVMALAISLLFNKKNGGIGS